MSVADEIGKLNDLLQQGAISQQEYGDAKALLLNGPRSGNDRLLARRALMRKIVILILWPLTVLSGVFFGYGIPGEINVDVKQAQWMPAGATEGCQYHGGAFILGPPAYYYEYTISEADFLKAFERHSEDFQEIEEPLWVPRYYSAVISRTDYDFDELSWRDEYYRAIHAEISNGLAYTNRVEDRQTIVAYVRERGRAFVYYTTR